MPDPRMELGHSQAAEPPFAPQLFAAADLLPRIEALQEENLELGRELLRCYEQLNLVFQITEYIASLQEPAAIRETLLRRFASLLQAGGLYRVAGGHVEVFAGLDSEGAAINVPAAAVVIHLEAEIKLALRSQRALVPTLTAEAKEALQGATALIGVLRESDAPSIVVVLRAAGEKGFDSGDMLAADSVLGYGGHVLNNVLLGRQLQQTALETVRALARAIDAKDNYTSGHSERVGWLARMVGEAMNLPPGELQILGWAGLLHDVGKIGVAEHILNKPGALTDDEFAEIKKHPQIGYDVLKPVTHFGPVLDAVLYHHENHDGSGYPTGLAADDIPLAARIVHVVDIFDALTSSRSYRKSFTIEQAIAILRKDSGRVTDPTVTDVFLQAFQAFMHNNPAGFAERFNHIPLAPHNGAKPPEVLP